MEKKKSESGGFSQHVSQPPRWGAGPLQTSGHVITRKKSLF